jgi:hypothetical protein
VANPGQYFNDKEVEVTQMDEGTANAAAEVAGLSDGDVGT